MSKNPYKQGGPIPSALGRVGDLYAEVRQLRLDMEKDVEVVRARESELREHLIDNLSKSDDTGAVGLTHRVMVRTKTKPKVEDWDAFYDYVSKSGRFDLLQKRIAERAILDMDEAGEIPPGVGRIHVPELSLTKAK